MTQMLSRDDFESYRNMFKPCNLQADLIYKVLFELTDEDKSFDLLQINDFIVRQQIYSVEDLLVFDQVLITAVELSESILRKCFEPNVKKQQKSDGFAVFLLIKWCARFRKAAQQKPVNLTLRGSEACVHPEPQKQKTV